MNTQHIDEFYFTCSEVLCALYASFPRRTLLLVEDIAGPIRWDMTGLPDTKSRACFEAMIWLADHDLLRYRSLEPRDIGIEGAVLTQRAFVLLTGTIARDDGSCVSRIDALLEARRARVYTELGTVINDLLRANCLWGAPVAPSPLPRSTPLIAEDDA